MVFRGVAPPVRAARGLCGRKTSGTALSIGRSFFQVWPDQNPLASQPSGGAADEIGSLLVFDGAKIANGGGRVNTYFRNKSGGCRGICDGRYRVVCEWFTVGLFYINSEYFGAGGEV